MRMGGCCFKSPFKISFANGPDKHYYAKHVFAFLTIQ